MTDKNKETQKLTIEWNIPYVRQEISFDVFLSKCRNQYKKYFAEKTDEEIQVEYEYITGKKVKTVKTVKK